MNSQLLQSSGQNYPEKFDGSLNCISLAVTCAFIKIGTLLAVGCNDGRIVVWDFIGRSIFKVLLANDYPVCSLNWTLKGHKLLSASTDNSVCIWHVLDGVCKYKIKFSSPILKVQFDPHNDQQFLVCLMNYASVLVKIGDVHKFLPVDAEGYIDIVASFDRAGEHIYTGDGKGKILVLDVETLQIVASFRIKGTSSATAVKSIEFGKRGFLINTSDCVIRVYNTKAVLALGKDAEPEPIQKLQDLVNKTTWKKCCFSGDGEYICAGSASQHAVYIWEKSTGNLVKILRGTIGELLLDVAWHPLRPIIVSISSALVFIWAQKKVAPDFKELGENIESEQRKSEFDLTDEGKSQDLNADAKHGEEIEEDVQKAEPVAAFSSSDEKAEDENASQILPIAPEVEDPEDGLAVQGGLDGNTSKDDSGTTRDYGDAVSAKKQKMNDHDINLPDAPADETHPSVSSKTIEDKQSSGGEKDAGRPKK